MWEPSRPGNNAMSSSRPFPGIVTDPDVIAAYVSDASNTKGHAEALVRPERTEEVAAIVAHCQRRGIPLTVSASRTSTTASSVPMGGWILSMERMARVRAIGAEHAVADAGVILAALQEQVRARGRMFPPDPTSRHSSTLGAAIACNASGARSFRYGPTRAWIAGMTVVLPTGEILRIDDDTPTPTSWPEVAWSPPHPKNAAGYASSCQLLRLFVGHEGTLGVVTEATVRLTAAPVDTFSLWVWCADRPQATLLADEARRRARLSRLGAVSPSAIEYLDHHSVSMIRQRMADVPDQARAAVLFEQEVHDEAAVDDHLQAWADLLDTLDHVDTLVAHDAPAKRHLEALRHAVPATINERVTALGIPKIGTDFAVTDAAMPSMFEAYERTPVPHVLFGHLGDNHLHLNMLPRDANELVAARQWYEHLATLALKLGGTVSAEHGIGKLKRPWLAAMAGPKTLATFVALKQHLDPNWVLCRGNLMKPPPSDP